MIDWAKNGLKQSQVFDKKGIMRNIYVIKHTIQDPEENDGNVTEIDKVLVTVEGDINVSVENWLKDFQGFVIGAYESTLGGKPRFHLTPAEWFEYE